MVERYGNESKFDSDFDQLHQSFCGRKRKYTLVGGFHAFSFLLLLIQCRIVLVVAAFYEAHLNFLID